MAMTKKEQAEMKAAIDRADLLASLRWTAPVKKDVPPPDSGGYSEGWDFNAYSMVVDLWWSTSVTHGSGPAPIAGKHRSGSQNARWLFSTKAKALAAMRFEIETQSAQKLMKLDRLLRDEDCCAVGGAQGV